MENGIQLNKCRKCLLYELADKAAFESVKSYLEAMPAQQKADDAEYQRRLDICRGCDSLLSAMCRKCGCYVEIRAADKDAHCPRTIPLW